MSTPKKSRHQEYRDRKASELQALQSKVVTLETVCKELRLGRDIVSAKAIANNLECIRTMSTARTAKMESEEAVARYSRGLFDVGKERDEALDNVRSLSKTKRRLLRVNFWAIMCSCCFACLGFVLLVVVGIQSHNIGELRDQAWRTIPAPPVQKLQVITYGFTDKAGVWRSYDTGEAITVQQWKP